MNAESERMRKQNGHCSAVLEEASEQNMIYVSICAVKELA